MDGALLDRKNAGPILYHTFLDRTPRDPPMPRGTRNSEPSGGSPRLSTSHPAGCVDLFRRRGGVTRRAARNRTSANLARRLRRRAWTTADRLYEAPSAA